MKDAIRGRVLSEFPTIFALSLPRQKLQKSFITEEEYLNQNGNEPLNAVSDSLMSRCPADNHDQELSPLSAVAVLDEERIMRCCERTWQREGMPEQQVLCSSSG